MGWVIELLLLEPAQIAHCPALLPRLDATVLEHEGAHLLTMNAQHFDRCGSCPDEIAHRLVAFVRDPNRRQLAGAKQPRQGDRIPTVRLHPIARLSRNQRRRHHRALVT